MLASDMNQLKKGILKILVLKLLSEDKKYGYELLLEISKRSEEFFKMKEGTLYPILYKLEEGGFVISEWQLPNDKVKAKKYYFITQKGIVELNELIEFWDLLIMHTQDLLN